jgi:hypothetical protein
MPLICPIHSGGFGRSLANGYLITCTVMGSLIPKMENICKHCVLAGVLMVHFLMIFLTYYNVL